MSQHATTYVPKSRFAKWFESRLPIAGLMHSSFIAFPVPRNLTYFWTFGAILIFMLGAQIVTGVWLAMHYVPHANLAFESVEAIMRDVNYGWLLRYLHANGASMFFIAVYIHIFRNLYYGSYKAPREVLYLLGIIIFILMMATAFMGYVLPWGQMSFWGATVITNLFSAIPLVGDSIVSWLLGGFAVDNAALNRFFSLHYLLPFVIAGVVMLHIWALHIPGSSNPTGIEVKGPEDTVPFHPYFTAKDGFGLCVFLLVFCAFVFFMPNALGHPDNYIPANPLSTPSHIVPEWYFWPFYAILRAFTVDFLFIPAKLWGVLAMFAAILLLFFLPWLDTSPVRSGNYRPMFKQVWWLLIIDVLILGYCGGAPAEEPYVRISQIASAYYFAHFLIILPIVSRIERPLPLPNSISEAVLKKQDYEGGPIGVSQPASALVGSNPAE